MQDRKEDFKVTLNSIKEKVRDWEYRHLLTARFIEYFFFFGLVLFATLYGFAHLNLIHTEPVSALYMLSALVQSQAAIVAIVVSLTLIAVQLTASAYTPRVIRIFLKTPDMWYLLSFYGFSIFLGLLFLKMIRAGEDSSQIVIFYSSLEYSISFIYALGISSFALLFLYFGNTINLLNPANIIHRLQIEITKDNLLNSEDPIQPIMDIVHGSIMNYDIETTRVGLKAVTQQIIKVSDSNGEEKITEHFCKHLKRVGKLTVSREDEEATLEVIINLCDFMESTAEKGLELATFQAAESLGHVGENAAKKGLEFATLGAATFLVTAGTVAAEEGLEDATRQTIRSLGTVGAVAAERGNVVEAAKAAMSLAGVGRTAAEEGFEDATRQAIKSLGDVGRTAVEKGEGLGLATSEAAKSLIDIGTATVKKGIEDATKQAAVSFAELTILSEVNVKIALLDYESKLEEQDRESFQKFMKIYEQELEKLRVEK